MDAERNANTLKVIVRQSSFAIVLAQLAQIAVEEYQDVLAEDLVHASAEAYKLED